MPQSKIKLVVLVSMLWVFASIFAHAQTPNITSVMPNLLGIGQDVTITGTNFGSSGSATFSGV